MFSDPILRSLFNLPDQHVHLRWSNKKVSGSENNIRPDSAISSRSQLQWSHDWGYGEAKTYEPTNNNHALAKDMIRIAMFNKNLINKANIRATIGFQINGFRITFYVIELNFHAIYTMTELCYIDIPQSVEQIDQITTNSNLRALAQVAHAFDMLRNTSLRCTNEEFTQKKTESIKFEDLESLISKKRDRASPCSSRF
ncbi:hypothetical protein BDC45DRAFT_311031 [Circinella umbellata]|nr:hypothetical protein BDC45DRAFT_311031 [Circinella umbellata]